MKQKAQREHKQDFSILRGNAEKNCVKHYINNICTIKINKYDRVVKVVTTKIFTKSLYTLLIRVNFNGRVSEKNYRNRKIQ